MAPKGLMHANANIHLIIIINLHFTVSKGSVIIRCDGGGEGRNFTISQLFILPPPHPRDGRKIIMAPNLSDKLNDGPLCFTK